MAEMVASAVVGETLSRISSFLIDKPGEQKPSDVERLEMAHIKMEAALQISKRWQISHVPVLCWRSKLKRAAEECDETLRHCKQRAMEDEVIRQGISQSPFPKRVAHAAKSFMSSFIIRGKDESSSPVNVRRFERFAEGAGEFLKFVEFGATPHQYMFFNPLVRQLLAGQALRYQVSRVSKFYFLGIRPMSFEERGVEAICAFVFQDFRAPTKSFSIGFMLRLSESSDIFGIIMSCMESVTPHFRDAAKVMKRELIQLPTQDFSWQTQTPYWEDYSYWVNAYNTITQWLRPNPLCCNEHKHDLITHASSSSIPNVSSPASSRLASTFMEQVIGMYLQCHIYAHDKRLQNLVTKHGRKGRGSTLNLESALLKLEVLFVPHDSPEGIEPTTESFAFEVIDGKEQEMVHSNASLLDVDEKMLPKAIEYLSQNSGSRMYQMCLRSTHGTAHLCVGKTTTDVQSAGIGESSQSQSHVWNKRVDQIQGGRYGVKACHIVEPRDILKVWVVRASVKLNHSNMYWAGN
ncbi:unnamed protein product [Alopecurus aequalis]